MKTITILERTVMHRIAYRKYFKEEKQITILYDGERFANHYEDEKNPRLRKPFQEILKTRSVKDAKAYLYALGRKDTDKWQKDILEKILGEAM